MNLISRAFLAGCCGAVDVALAVDGFEAVGAEDFDVVGVFNYDGVAPE